MKRLILLATLLALCTGLSAQDPDLYYFGITDGKIFWQMEYDNCPLTQAELADTLKGRDLLSQLDASTPGRITAKLPMHTIRYEGAGIRPEHTEILLTGAQVSGDVVIRVSEGRYTARVENMVLKMARPSTQGGIDGTHPFEYHFKHHWGIIKNTLFNTYLAAALDFEFNNLFLVASPGDAEAEKAAADKPSPNPYTAYSNPTPSRVTLSPTTSEASLVLPVGVTVFDLRSGEALEPRNVSKADGFYGQWQCSLFDSKQSVSFVCFKPEAFQTQIVSAEREAADSTEALCQRFQAVAGINGSFFNVRERTSITFLKDEGEVVYADNQAPQANGLVAVDGAQVRFAACEEKAFEDADAVPEPDVMVSGPVLMADGKMKHYQADTPQEQLFYMRRHPRSIVGKDARGAIWFIAVDGRAEGQGEGMSITEAAALSWKLGLVEALNLDGGGSSTLWVRPAGVINHPCDNRQFDPYGQRIVPNAILVQ